MIKYQLSELDLKKCALIINKLDRVVDGINHGRSVFWDKKNKLYYKVFNKGYIRRQNFITAYEAGFFDKLAPALNGIIYDGDDIIGYVTKLGDIVGNFKESMRKIMKTMKDVIEDSNFFYGDFVVGNLVEVDGEISLIDLESVWSMDLLKANESTNKVDWPKEYKWTIPGEYRKLLQKKILQNKESKNV